MSVATLRTRATTDPASVRDGVMSRVEERIERLLAGERTRWAAVDARATTPVDAIATLVASGGKRIRPAFCVSGYLAAGGNPDEPAVVSAAAALELLHACALLHDDVMDDSALRRGSPTAHVLHAEQHRARDWSGESRRYGESVAVLAGDLALVYSEQLMGEAGRAVRDLWDETRSELIIGQFLDTAVAAQRIIDTELSRWVAVCKSGRYTIDRPLALGAVLAGRPDLVDVFSVYGLALGEAFQLRDDLIDAFGDTAVAGKPTGQDVEQHKVTLLVALAMERDSRAREVVSTGDSQALRDLLVRNRVRVDVEERIDELVGKATAAVAQAPLEPLWQRELVFMAHRVAYRDK
jgi:geranylgeranyl diphosphate synthase type I